MQRWTALWNVAAVAACIALFVAVSDLLRHKTENTSNAPIVITVVPE